MDEETYAKAEAASLRDRIAERIARHRNPGLTGRPDIIVMPDEYATCYALADAVMPELGDLIALGRRQAAEEIARRIEAERIRRDEAGTEGAYAHGVHDGLDLAIDQIAEIAKETR